MAWLGLDWLGLDLLGLAWLGLAWPSHSSYLTAYEVEQRSQTPAYKIHTPRNYPEESILHVTYNEHKHIRQHYLFTKT